MCWLITGTAWGTQVDTNSCQRTIYIFSVVVIANFWIHILTPLLFMLFLCCSRLGVCSCPLWTFFNNLIEAWTSNVRMLLSVLLSLPLGVSMLVVGSFSLQSCSGPGTVTVTNLTVSSSVGDKAHLLDVVHQERSTSLHIPLWLTVSGALVLLAPVFYFIYDKFCKPEDVNKSELKSYN